MLRLIVALLLLANLVFLAWSQGWLGAAPANDREPERLARQVTPQAVRLVPASAASAAAAVATAAQTACLEAGPFDDAALAAAVAALGPLPEGALERVAGEQPGRWIVYMGRFTEPDALARKRDELRRRGVPFEPVSGVPDYTPGLSLGSFDNRAAADAALAALVARDVRTARVVGLPPTVQTLLRAPGADAALRARLSGAAGVAFRPCAAPR